MDGNGFFLIVYGFAALALGGYANAGFFVNEYGVAATDVI